MTTGMPLSKTLIVNAGMGAATSFVMNGSVVNVGIVNDTGLSLIGTVAGDQFKRIPVLGDVVSELIQKIPLKPEIKAPIKEDKND